MNVKIIIPSRLGSSRFPNKPLAKINGKEMILHVCERASKAYPVIVATPDDEIMKLVEDHGFEAYKTSYECETGTDRLAELAKVIDADIYVNVQGDEPLINIDDINSVVLRKELCYNEVIGSMSPLAENSPNIVKVHTNNGKLLSMSRKGTSEYKQCGLYAFDKEQLLAYGNLSHSEKLKSLKQNENIELMRFVELGFFVYMQVINGSPAVDEPEDIIKIMEVISNG